MTHRRRTWRCIGNMESSNYYNLSISYAQYALNMWVTTLDMFGWLHIIFIYSCWLSYYTPTSIILMMVTYSKCIPVTILKCPDRWAQRMCIRSHKKERALAVLQGLTLFVMLRQHSLSIAIIRGLSLSLFKFEFSTWICFDGLWISIFECSVLTWRILKHIDECQHVPAHYGAKYIATIFETTRHIAKTEYIANICENHQPYSKEAEKIVAIFEKHSPYSIDAEYVATILANHSPYLKKCLRLYNDFMSVRDTLNNRDVSHFDLTMALFCANLKMTCILYLIRNCREYMTIDILVTIHVRLWSVKPEWKQLQNSYVCQWTLYLKIRYHIWYYQLNDDKCKSAICTSLIIRDQIW